jgi:hypothetical protein
LDRAVLKALAKDPNDRFQTADEFQACLVQIADLVRRPAGWLETMAFDASGMDHPSRESGALASAPAFAPTEPYAELAAPTATSPAGAVESQPQSVAPPKRRRLGVATVLLFLAGMLIAGLAVVGLVTVIQGARP